MAIIVINDLAENIDLDRKAMHAIAGGSRFRSWTGAVGKQQARGRRIVDFRTPPVRKPPAS
jgi:hypothetical protein